MQQHRIIISEEAIKLKYELPVISNHSGKKKCCKKYKKKGVRCKSCPKR